MSFYKIFKYNVCEIFVNVHINVYLCFMEYGTDCFMYYRALYIYIYLFIKMNNQ